MGSVPVTSLARLTAEALRTPVLFDLTTPAVRLVSRVPVRVMFAALRFPERVMAVPVRAPVRAPPVSGR
jgi:hypothetical protein